MFELSKFGERIRKYIRDQQLTITQLASDIGISQQQLNKYINGKSEPGVKTFAKIVEHGADANYLIMGVRSINPPHQKLKINNVDGNYNVVGKNKDINIVSEAPAGYIPKPVADKKIEKLQTEIGRLTLENIELREQLNEFINDAEE